ncbi:HIRAN domain-containing protein [Desulfofundulus thermobenzoicus]|uniref:HIRAN domain-containing protein n=1 Tax=Desulfofundulus thermobenzoicus TaxID=29376 RepID=UPI001A9ADD74
MLELLKAAVRNGYADEWPEEEGEDFLAVVRGADFLLKGAVWGAIRELEKVKHWHAAAFELLREFVPEDLLVNAAAELYHHSFFPGSHLLFILGALLGPVADDVQEYFFKAREFFTRVVGLRYEERFREAALLAPGMPVVLVREPENKVDPSAVAVLSPWGTCLGYLRAPLASVISSRCEDGETFFACVAAILGAEYDPNERLHLKVRSGPPEGKIIMLKFLETTNGAPEGLASPGLS